METAGETAVFLFPFLLGIYNLFTNYTRSVDTSTGGMRYTKYNGSGSPFVKAERKQAKSFRVAEWLPP